MQRFSLFFDVIWGYNKIREYGERGEDMLSFCILDDEPEQTKLLNKMLSDYFTECNVTFETETYHSSELFLERWTRSEKKYHIYFLDVLMPGKNGIQVAREIRKKDKTAHILFLTTSPEYALEGYEVRAYNYILKPLRKEKLYGTLTELSGAFSLPVKQLQIVKNGVVKHILYREIVYIEVRRNKLLLVLHTGEEVETYSTITEMESCLKNEDIFTRTHRSYIVNMQYIKEFTSTEICLRPEYRIPVSRTYSGAVKKDYLNFAKQLFS